jgi:FeS assembly SUF system protein
MQEQKNPASGAQDSADLEKRVKKAIRKIFDPEIPVNIYDLGLIYSLDIDAGGAVAITMTLTAPNCPVAGTLPGDVKSKVEQVAGVTDVKVELTWDPPWTKDRMSEAAKLELGMDLDGNMSPSHFVRFGK